MAKKLTLGSLFDGSGGFPLGAFFSGITPVWASEIEPFPIRVTTKRFPEMKHLGDITKIDGSKIEPVDIITFGSPCTDLSVAGKRAGLDGEQSSLFYEAIRVITEMRSATDGKYPKYIVWENVPGAFFSNQGADFRAVLESIIQIKEKTAKVPEARKTGWPYADLFLGKGWSVAYRTFDAKYFGVPQRRRRIFLVADFGSECAGEILFESEGLSRDFKTGHFQTEGTTSDLTGCFGTPRTNRRVIALENHPSDSRLKVCDDGNFQTLTSRMGTGGSNGPLALEINDPVCILGNMIGRELKNGPNGMGVEKDIAYTLNTVDRHAVAYSLTTGSFTQARLEEASTLMARDSIDPQIVQIMPCPEENFEEEIEKENYIIRRLTPKECLRLQGFPEVWCENLETENPTETEIDWWSDVFFTYWELTKKTKNPKSKNQVVKWLKDPYSKSAEYKMWGNGVALPCVIFVLRGISLLENTNSYQ